MSKGEADLGQLLRQEFPNHTIKSQFHLRVAGVSLYFDYVIPTLKLYFEVDGRQHEEYVPFFHEGNRRNFERSKSRDTMKDLWASSNGYTLIRFHYKDRIDIPTLREKIKAAAAFRQ